MFTAGAGSAYGVKAEISVTAKTVAKSLTVDIISGAAGSPEMISMMAGLGVSFIGGYYGEKAINRIPKITGGGAGRRTSYDYLDDQLGSLKGKVKINKYASSDEINNFWKQEGYSQPPYNSKSVVLQVELLEDTKFVRVYDEVHTQLSGG